MAKERGIVTRLQKDTAWVTTIRSSACEHCEGRDSCTVIGSGKEMEVEAVNVVGAQVGDRVLVGMATANLVKASFLTYIFPILALMAGAAWGQEAGTGWGLSPNVGAVIFGFAFFAAAFVLVRRFSKNLGSKSGFRPQVVKVIKRA